jgi:hypothetical protein
MVLESRIFEEFKQPASQTRIDAALWRIFSSNKSVLASSKIKFYANCLPKN